MLVATVVSFLFLLFSRVENILQSLVVMVVVILLLVLVLLVVLFVVLFIVSLPLLSSLSWILELDLRRGLFWLGFLVKKNWFGVLVFDFNKVPRWENSNSLKFINENKSSW